LVFEIRIAIRSKKRIILVEVWRRVQSTVYPGASSLREKRSGGWRYWRTTAANEMIRREAK